MASNLSIRWKIIISCFSLLLISIVVVSFVWIINVKKNSEREIRTFRESEMQKVKRDLKNYVDIAYETVKSNYEDSQNNEYLQNRYGRRLVSVIDIAESIVRNNMAGVKNGRITLGEAKKRAKTAIKKIRFDQNTGYIWINDTGKPYPRMVMHPTVPSLDGKVMDNPAYNCALGRGENLFKAFVDVTERNGVGFVDYLWPKPTRGGLTTKQPKLSYVRLIREWNWIIGTGIYIDDALVDAIEKAKNTIEKMRYNGGVGYFWINDTGKPFPRMVMHSTAPDLNGKVLNDQKYNCAFGRGENLFKAFVEVTEKTGSGFVDYLWPKPTRDGLNAEQPKLSFGRRFKPLNWIIGTGKYVDEIDRKVEARTEVLNARLKKMLYTTIFATILLLVPAFIGLWFIAASFTKPIVSILSAIQQIGKGKFRTRLDIDRGDEIGQLADGLNDMINGLSDLVHEINDGIATLSDSSSDMTAVSGRMAEISNSNMDKANTVAAAAEEMSLNMGAVADAMEETSGHVDAVAASTEEMSNSIGEIAGNTVAVREDVEKSTKQANETFQQVTKLGHTVDEIGIVTETINEISDKTSLLALNATIEAAGAGEAGKGFTVVANEIKGLARQTFEATANIAKKIKEVQESTDHTVKGIEQLTAAINQIDEVVASASATIQQQNIATREISRNIGQTSQRFTQINASVGEASKAASQVNDEIVEVSELMGENNQSSDKVEERASELNQLAERLQTLVEKFEV